MPCLVLIFNLSNPKMKILHKQKLVFCHMCWPGAGAVIKEIEQPYSNCVLKGLIIVFP